MGAASAVLSIIRGSRMNSFMTTPYLSIDYSFNLEFIGACLRIREGASFEKHLLSETWVVVVSSMNDSNEIELRSKLDHDSRWRDYNLKAPE